MTFYWMININTWNGYKTNKLVSFNVVVVMTYKGCQTVTTKLKKSMLFKNT